MTNPTDALASRAVTRHRQRVLMLVLGLNLLVVAGQAAVGVLAHSLGLLADAGHSLSDVAAVGLSLYAVHLTRRPTTAHRSYGWHRSTVLAAQANSAALLVVSLLIAYAGVRRLLDPPQVEGGWVLAAAVVSTITNGCAALLLRDRHGDLNMRSALLHMAGDAAASAGVAAAAVVILVTGGFDWLDPAVSLLITSFIAIRAMSLVREATDVLLESTPPGLDVDELVSTLCAVVDVEGVHDLHAWSLSPDVLAVSAHLVITGQPSLAKAQAVAETAKAVLADRFAIAHATLELECSNCVDGDTDPCRLGAITASHRPSTRAHGHSH